MVKVNTGEFIALEFTGKITDTGEVFDTNRKKDSPSIGMNAKKVAPFICRLGYEMLPSGLDTDIVGKETVKDYEVTLLPSDAFGKRDSSLVRMIPTKAFEEQNIKPIRGMQIRLDGQLVRVLSSSGGRTLVDFNHPLAGKSVSYTYTILRIVDDETEQINSVQDFLFRQRFDFKKKEGSIEIFVPESMKENISLFSDAFKKLSGNKLKVTLESKKS